MPSRINSTTTSPGGLISTGDSDNSLLIQTGDTTAITISSTQQVALTNPLPVSSGGTGANSNAAAPFALKGANSDITSLSGLTTALSVAQGGTGANTATAAFNALNPMTTTGDILYEASPTVAARLGIGSSGQVLTVSGGVPAWTTVSAGLPGLTGQVFTSNGTFTIPTGVTRLKVTVIGGGGGGAGNNTNLAGGGGGGGLAIAYLTGLTSGNTLSVTIGGGGGSSFAAAGTAGGTTSVASGTQSISTITANGGAGGPYANMNTASGGSASGGTINISGGLGGRGSYFSNCAGTMVCSGGGGAAGGGDGGNGISQSNAGGSNGGGGGAAGGGPFGGGGRGRQFQEDGTNRADGLNGRGFGSGGSGGASSGTSIGGNGSAGAVIFEF
jgi:hypothetical protein